MSLHSQHAYLASSIAALGARTSDDAKPAEPSQTIHFARPNAHARRHGGRVSTSRNTFSVPAGSG